MKNARLESVKHALRHPFTSPGFYPLSFLVHDGPLCAGCVRGNFRSVITDTKANVGAWNISVDVLWEGEYWCADCGEEIETAYGPVEREIEL